MPSKNEKAAKTKAKPKAKAKPRVKARRSTAGRGRSAPVKARRSSTKRQAPREAPKVQGHAQSVGLS